MTRFSANLGFLWRELSLPDAIRAAKAAGFDAVECHWPHDVPAREVAAALAQTGLPMISLNTSRGDLSRGEFGLSALPDRVPEARAAIDEALDYASRVNASAIHLLAGNATGAVSCQAFSRNLHYATRAATLLGITILIEPLNRHDAPDYFLHSTAQARRIIEEVAAPNLKLLFDCYHVGRTDGDPIPHLRTLLPIIGHVQFASVPDRGRPDRGDVDYTEVFGVLSKLGYDAPLGAEYRPGGSTEQSLSWMTAMR